MSYVSVYFVALISCFCDGNNFAPCETNKTTYGKLKCNEHKVKKSLPGWYLPFLTEWVNLFF